MARRLNNTLLQAIISASRDGVVVADARAKDVPIVYVNPAFEQMTGYSADEILGQNCRFLQGEDRRQRSISEMRESIAQGQACEVLLRNYRKDGTLFWNQLHLQPLMEKERAAWWIGIARDVGALHELKDRLRHRQRALNEARSKTPDDRLTGLHSRVFFDESLVREWNVCVREARTLNLFLFAIDHLDRYLETFGRRAGDSILRQVARAVRAGFQRSSDFCSRYDEQRFGCFASSAEEAQLDDFVAGICERVKALCIHNPHSPTSRFITVSGAALSIRPDNSCSLEQMLEALESQLEKALVDGGDRAVTGRFEDLASTDE